MLRDNLIVIYNYHKYNNLFIVFFFILEDINLFDMASINRQTLIYWYFSKTL